MREVRRVLEAILVGSRWLVAPFLVGLVMGLAALLFKFVIKLADFVATVVSTPPAEVIVGILNLVDLTLTANLIVIVIFSSYENFLTPFDHGTHTAWPDGLTRIGFLVSAAALAGCNWGDHDENVSGPSPSTTIYAFGGPTPATEASRSTT